MTELNRIKQIIKDNKLTLKSQFKVKEIGLFGSFVRGDYSRKSDIDVLVSFSRTPGIFDYIRTENYLKGLLKRKVDLVMKGSLKPAIGKVVMREVVYV
ncbi:MAG: nucleotidyltransferase family protein [Candidatus Omnitrophica bacterium]|nr:nucleotidyltransferase family protein [Candidatus Omnitrophota bacterium]